MRKVVSVIVLAAGMLFANNTNAQVKIGYIRIDEIVGVMPELAPEKVNMDTVGQQFVKDSILPTLNYKQTELQKKFQEYADSTKSKAVRDLIAADIKEMQEELGGADSYIQQVLQAKQQEYLRPYYAKAKKAIEAVAKKKGYTHIMATDTFLVAPETDDISYAVLAELNIKLPEQEKPKPAPAKPAGK
jgi:outer membrane protein